LWWQQNPRVFRDFIDDQGETYVKLNFLIVMTVVLGIAVLPVMAQQTWSIDPAHSAAQFQVRHLMISTVRGEFEKMSGTVFFDGKDFSSVRAEAVIEVASINTRVPRRDDDLRSTNFFDAASYPSITFQSKRVEKINGRNFNLVGNLTIRGITKEVTLAVEASPIIKGMGGERRIGAHATTELNRQDFGVQWNRTLDGGGVVVGDEVQITLDLELTQPATK
jgi:polyisoprenoid-binding protein YceI